MSLARPRDRWGDGALKSESPSRSPQATVTRGRLAESGPSLRPSGYSGPRWGGIRASLAGRILALLVLSLALSGCEEPEKREVRVQQPIAFSHKKHLEYFTSGKHREEKIAMHLKLLDTEEVPEEIAKGECAACHDDLAQKADCAGCHVLSQDPALRERKDIRPCIVCHPGTWNGSEAGIPSTVVCRCCHSAQPRTDSPEERRLREYLTKNEDIPWVRINTAVDNVHNSHSSHVRYAGFTCTRCHDDVSGLTAPPATATVFSMTGCLRCHTENHARTDCIACHK